MSTAVLRVPPRPLSQAMLDKLLLLAALVVAWHLLSLVTGPEVLMTPWATARRLAQLMASPDFAARWFEVDPGWQVLRLLAAARIVTIRTPQRAVYPEPLPKMA